MHVFIGCASEDKALADELIDHMKEVVRSPAVAFDPWHRDVFTLSRGTMDDLAKATRTSDFGVFIFSGADRVESRGVTSFSPRDNVVFEAGLFAGALGLERTFILLDAASHAKVPSDLAGITLATYGGGAELATAARQIAARIDGLGPRLRVTELTVDEAHHHMYEAMRDPRIKVFKHAAVATNNFAVSNVVSEFDREVLAFMRRDGTSYYYVFNTGGDSKLAKVRSDRALRLLGEAQGGRHRMCARSIKRKQQTVNVLLFLGEGRNEAISVETNNDLHVFTLYQEPHAARSWKLFFDELWGGAADVTAPAATNP